MGLCCALGGGGALTVVHSCICTHCALGIVSGGIGGIGVGGLL
jgi:hypothetical protein